MGKKTANHNRKLEEYHKWKKFFTMSRTPTTQKELYRLAKRTSNH